MEKELKIFEAILPRNPAMPVLANIFVNSEYIAATDTKIMVRKKNNYDVESAFCIVNSKARAPIAIEGVFEGVPINYTSAHGYPNVNRVFGKHNGEKKIKRAEGYDFISALYIAAEEGYVIDFIRYSPAIKKIAKALGDAEVTELRVGENTPIYMAIGDYEFLFVPMVFQK